MAIISRELVLKKLKIAFPDSDISQQALQSLDRYGENPTEIMADLVHLAIIKSCGGQLWRLRELVEQARRDFRDVLYPAQAPEAHLKVGLSDPRRFAPLPRKKPSASKQIKFETERIAMEKRDHAQWVQWLSS